MQRSGSLAGGGRNLPHQVHLRDRLPPGAHARLIPLWKTLSVRILTDLNMALPGAAVCEDPHRQRSLQRKQTGVGSRLLQVAVAFSMGMVACKPRLAWFDSPVCTARCLMIIASPAGTPTAFRPAPHHPELRVRLHRLAPSAQADVADGLIWGSGGGNAPSMKVLARFTPPASGDTTTGFTSPLDLKYWRFTGCAPPRNPESAHCAGTEHPG